MIIFDHQDITIEITKRLLSAQKNHSKRPVTFRANLSQNKVKLVIHGREFLDSYPILSSIESLVSLYLRKRFTAKVKRFEMNVEWEDYIYQLSVEKQSNGDGHIPSMKLELNREKLIFGEQYAHIFQQALRKSMNWISPMPEWNRDIID